uniref:(California timema) hypothetical protein n=1 Tax=Timema californicum TaxID=61474 RepID=A0A7R9PAY4_TIMCA|nr:unnamed protein product [Timema californicum]
MIQSAQVVSVSTSEISISWIPVYPRSPCALGYRVCWGVKGADISLQICRSNLSTDATSFTIAQLQSDTNYDITLEAWLGGSVFSEQWSSDALTNVGSPVSSLRVKSVNTYSFEVHWTCLTSPSCTLDYDVCWTDLSSGNSSGCTPTGEISDSTPSFIIPGLNSCTDYNITVSATTVGGTYFEASVLARTPLSAESLRSLSAASVTNTSFVVQWEIPENSVRCGHSLDICASNLYTNHKYCTSNATGSKWERGGLEACSLYDVTATLSVGHHVLPPVYISVATSRPNDTMLESMSVADMTRNNISVSWVPMYPGLPCSLGYQVCWGVAGVDPTIQACSSDLPRDARNFTIAGLRRRTNYTVQVMARFDGDVMSLPVQVVALTAVFSVPSTSNVVSVRAKRKALSAPGRRPLVESYTSFRVIVPWYTATLLLTCLPSTSTNQTNRARNQPERIYLLNPPKDCLSLPALERERESKLRTVGDGKLWNTLTARGCICSGVLGLDLDRVPIRQFISQRYIKIVSASPPLLKPSHEMTMEAAKQSVEDVGVILQRFGTLDYIVFLLMLGVCALIGIYFGFFDGKMSAADYLMGGRSMSTFPVAMLLIASFISGITLLGTPSEIYVYGIQYVYIASGVLLMAVFMGTAYLPVFHDLQLTSTYEVNSRSRPRTVPPPSHVCHDTATYLEKRFDKRVRLFGSFLFSVSIITWMPIVIYVPALAFNQVTGVNVHIITPVVCAVCIFYTCVVSLESNHRLALRVRPIGSPAKGKKF